MLRTALKLHFARNSEPNTEIYPPQEDCGNWLFLGEYQVRYGLKNTALQEFSEKGISATVLGSGEILPESYKIRCFDVHLGGNAGSSVSLYFIDNPVFRNDDIHMFVM